MRKVIVLAILAIFILPDSKLSAQESGTYKNIVGINPLGIAFNIYSVHYSRIMNDGNAEINIPFFYWNEPFEFEGLSFIGLGAKYRIYKDGHNKGVFYGGGISIISLSWDYTLFSSVEENITATTFIPLVEIGYRINWDNGFTLAPDLELGYSVGTVEASDGSEPDFGSVGMFFGIGIGGAWRF